MADDALPNTRALSGGGRSLVVIDEKEVQEHVEEESATTSFAPPQDIMGERISFSDPKFSAQGIIEYGRSPSLSNSEDRTVKMERQQSPKRRGSSLELRKSIPSSLGILNANSHKSIMDDMKQSIASDGAGRKFSRTGSLLVTTNICKWFRHLFLNSSYPLRRQMLLTFGTVSSLTILLVMIVSIIASIATGNVIKEETNTNVEQWMDGFAVSTSRLVAEALAPKIMPSDLVDLMVEIAQDRFSGYPATKDDSMTPFYDAENKTNTYPLKNKPLPLDWDFSHTLNDRGNVNDKNHVEHVGARWPWYSHPRLSTDIAMFSMQGACDPGATDPLSKAYYPNCTDANNNINTGGVIAPNPTTKDIYRKGADMSPFLKALFEYHNILQLGYYFANSGAGASVFFPHYELDGRSEYESTGCDWMRADNPIDPTKGPIGTEEEIALCHPKDTSVVTREYNPLERAWCVNQALNPSRMHNVGPYIDAWSDERRWLMTAGRAVYDRITGSFVGCISVDFTFDTIKQILEDVKVDDLGILTLVRNDEVGTVVWSPNFSFDTAEDTTTVDDPVLESGVNLNMFNKLRSNIDWTKPWDSEVVRKSFEMSLVDNEEIHISAYPIPPIPNDYDSNYLPEMYAIFTLPRSKGLRPTLEGINEEVDANVHQIVMFTLIVGLAGMIIAIMLILATASWFVKPLKWMDKIGEQVVGKFGQEVDAAIDYTSGGDKRLPCSPRTELTALQSEFSIMIARFSGEGTAKRVKISETEKINLFDLGDEFSGLYNSRRQNDSFEFNYPADSSEQDPTVGKSIKHLGHNISVSSSNINSSSKSDSKKFGNKAYKSPLFHWMAALIVTPTLIIVILISVVVLSKIANDLPSLITPVENKYFDITGSYRSSVAGILAIKASQVTERAARDTYLLTRLASWVFFGAIEMPSTFGTVEMLEFAEDCKVEPLPGQCALTKNRPCDCSWNDFTARGVEGACTSYPSGESRPLQLLHFEGQSTSVTWPNGDRNFTLYPAVARYPNSTAWWDNTTVLPGQLTNTRYDTTYDRVRTLSALSTAFIPLYNYDKSNDKPIAMYFGFENDGMVGGYSGCDYSFADLPHFQSTVDNRAATLQPNLCPLGKYGFDVRCRGWYADGKKKAVEGGNGTVHLHITPPYVFATQGGLIGQSITSPLIDPQNNQHIGQVLVDFVPASIFRSLESDNTKLSDGAFPFMITPESDALGHDTVAAPGFSLDGDGQAIVDLIGADDDAFMTIVQDMKKGKVDSGSFSNAGKNVYISYAPIYVRNFIPVNSSDITRGVQSETILVYSLALAETEEGLIQSFESIYAFSSQTVNICIGVLSAIIFVSTVLIVYIAFRVTSSMINPILQLLEVMKSINSMKSNNGDNIAKLSDYRGSCREVESVYKTTEMLYKVVQFANLAFYSGDLDVAYKVLRDALRLFLRLDNSKAVAVATNNLGNTMLTIYRTMNTVGLDEMCGMPKKEVIDKGVAYFAQSIKLGEESYDDFYNKQGWSEECLVFMQFLANRYFNRAIFFLTTSDDHDDPNEAKVLGFRDLNITMDMDCEIVNQCLESGFRINRVERYELMLSRARGLLGLVELGYSSEELYLDEQITSVYDDLIKALKNQANNPLVSGEISAAGRMQKLDQSLMQYYYHAKNDIVNAARVAIRMLVEDEYVIPGVEVEAAKMMLLYMDNAADDENCPDGDDGRIVFELQTIISDIEDNDAQNEQNRPSVNASGSASMLKSLKMSVSDDAKSYDGSVDGKEESNKASMRRSRRTSALKESSRGDFTMELF